MGPSVNGADLSSRALTLSAMPSVQVSFCASNPPLSSMLFNPYCCSTMSRASFLIVLRVEVSVLKS
jgi:hypothetical protein